MEEYFASYFASYILLAPDILVPLAWPIHGIEIFVLEAIRGIIRSSQQESPIIKIRNIPARLVRDHQTGFPFVCELLPKEQVAEDDVYEIVSPEDENNNSMEIASGSAPGSLQERTFIIREPACTLRTKLLNLSLRMEK